MRRMIRGTAVVWLLAIGGCRYYAPPAAEGPAPGADVRLELQQPQTLDFAEAALRDIVTVEGPVLSWSPDSVRVASNWVVSQRGSRNATLGEHVGIPRVQIASVSESKIHTGRTAALIAGGGVVVGGLFYALISGGNTSGSDSGGGGNGNPASSLVPR